MRAVVQRVSRASVSVAGVRVSAIDVGLLVLLGIGHGDTSVEVEAPAGTVARLRIFADEHGQMNRSVVEVAGAVLVVSQFTLHADTTRGNRTGFTAAAEPASPSRCTTGSSRCSWSGCEIAWSFARLDHPALAGSATRRVALPASASRERRAPRELAPASPARRATLPLAPDTR